MIGNEQLQIGIYNQLKAVGLKVYPYVPKTAEYPFAALGEEYITDASTKNKRHKEIYHVIHTFSESKNKSQINDMNNKVIEALSQPFSLEDGFYISDVKDDYTQTTLDPEVDGVFHGVLRFKFIISKE
ncbi:DUF3168 domain-containing protein [Bacillus toyonensis]|uniref:DUF3168 domain-containing protein n=1 Tax=Bacillus toyonensis TaxID=155322 RepID=UPI000BF0542A|nr:DUF3168 domain-containing protein [Bacillus toyonensis]PEK78327.1 hypothetical protein CN594_26440 [Bacillus toyonensis]PEO51228.1 hypothetical protein CN579_28425 [Bacillus toyonensis]PFY36887.1 hypothetical protein COL55_28430 [Bacillus toyonensis]PFY43852.1 hypothetical protein COL54_12480 [Bacillus toyonensis]PFY73573.1 hypothetical protein COL62_24355 [Bacillus toyonensis]